MLSDYLLGHCGRQGRFAVRKPGEQNKAADTETYNSVAQRRLSTLLAICKNISETKSPHEVSSFGQAVLEALASNGFDFPIAMIYSLRGDYEAYSPVNLPGSVTKSVCSLKGKLGIPDDHLAAPKKIDLWTSEEGFAPVFRDAVLSSNPILLHAKDGSLPEHLTEGLQPRGFGDPCQAVIVCPIRSIGFDYIAGFLVVGKSNFLLLGDCPDVTANTTNGKSICTGGKIRQDQPMITASL